MHYEKEEPLSWHNSKNPYGVRTGGSNPIFHGGTMKIHVLRPNLTPTTHAPSYLHCMTLLVSLAS